MAARGPARQDIFEVGVGEFGRARTRKEDARLVTGLTNWTDNIVLPGMLHMCFVRSPFAHARITSVDVSAAKSMPGVIAAFSGADFAGEQGSLPCAWPVTPDIVIPPHPPMATEEVRYVGEAVAVVIARDHYTAADAIAAVDVNYEPLPPVLDMRAALEGGLTQGARGRQQELRVGLWAGDPIAAFRDAPVVVERTYRQQRLIPSAMEPRAVVATSLAGEVVLWSTTPDPARGAVRAGCVLRHPGAADPGHRARRGRKLRLQAPGHCRGGARGTGLPQARQARSSGPSPAARAT